MGEIHAKCLKFAFMLRFACWKIVFIQLTLSSFSVLLYLNTLDVFNLTVVLNEQQLYIYLHFHIVQTNKTFHNV